MDTDEGEKNNADADKDIATDRNDSNTAKKDVKTENNINPEKNDDPKRKDPKTEKTDAQTKPIATDNKKPHNYFWVFILFAIIVLSGAYYLDTRQTDSDNTLLKGNMTDDKSDVAPYISGMRVNGIFGGALSFDGVDDYVDISSVANDLKSDKGTISMWIKGRGYLLVANNPGKYRDYFEFNTGVVSMRPDAKYKWHYYLDSPESADKWHYIAVVQDGNEPEVYMDGARKNITLTPKLFPANIDKTFWFDNYPVTQVNLGALRTSGNPYQFFKGEIDDVRIYNRVLGPDEIEKEFNRLEVSSDRLIGWWNFDETDGDIVKDSSGKGNNGKIKQNIVQDYYNITTIWSEIKNTRASQQKT